VLDAVRRTGGAVEDVTDAQIVDAIRRLARTEGIFAEPAGGVTVAVLKKLAEQGKLDPDAETVVINSGDGLKTLDAVAGTGVTATIKPSLAAFRAAGL
jgi:threonine synthase